MDKQEELRAILQEITEGKGRYSLDPLTHAGNTIEDMKALAVKAIAILDSPDATMEGLREAVYEYLTSDDLELEISARVAVEISNGLLALLSTHIDQRARELGYVKLDKDQKAMRRTSRLKDEFHGQVGGK